MDVGEAWTLDSDDELSCYGDDIGSNINIDDEAASASTNELVTLQVDRKSSTGSQVLHFLLSDFLHAISISLKILKYSYNTNFIFFQISTDSLDSAEEFVPVHIDVNSVKSVLNLYQKHRKISMSKIQPKKNQE